MYQRPSPNNPDITNMVHFERGVDYAIHEIAQIMTSGRASQWAMQQYTQNTWYENEKRWHEDNYYRTFVSHKRKFDGKDFWEAERNWRQTNDHYEKAFLQKITTTFAPIYQQHQQEKAQMQQEIDQLKHEVERLTVELKQRPTANSNNQFNK